MLPHFCNFNGCPLIIFDVNGLCVMWCADCRYHCLYGMIGGNEMVFGRLYGLRRVDPCVGCSMVASVLVCLH